jgi:hypothetical protein
MTKTRATVREIDGQLVLDDPDAVAVVNAIERHNCRRLFEINAERVRHFRQRAKDRGLTADDVVVALLAVDDPHGGQLAEVLMPGFDWQSIRDRGEVPIARGLAGRAGIQSALEMFDPQAAAKLREATEVAVVAVDCGVAEVTTAETNTRKTDA